MGIAFRRKQLDPEPELPMKFVLKLMNHRAYGEFINHRSELASGIREIIHSCQHLTKIGYPSISGREKEPGTTRSKKGFGRRRSSARCEI
jgi:hypothetical protein